MHLFVTMTNMNDTHAFPGNKILLVIAWPDPDQTRPEGVNMDVLDKPQVSNCQF